MQNKTGYKCLKNFFTHQPAKQHQSWQNRVPFIGLNFLWCCYLWN